MVSVLLQIGEYLSEFDSWFQYIMLDIDSDIEGQEQRRSDIVLGWDTDYWHTGNTEGLSTVTQQETLITLWLYAASPRLYTIKKQLM